MAAEKDEEFTRRLSAVRAAYGAMTGRPNISQTKFARELGMEDEAYRRWERGETRPQMDGLRRLRELTGISLDFLVCGAAYGYANPSAFLGQCTASFPQRLRWVRELMASEEAAAAAMKVSLRVYKSWESGFHPMPLEAMKAFALRFGVSMSYLEHGLPVDVAPDVLAQLQKAHPELWQIDLGRGKQPDDDKTAPPEDGATLSLRSV